MLLRDHNFIVVHIQKTGCSSISAALGLPQNPPEKHRTAIELRDYYGLSVWGRCFKFAVVRNPWERLVSWWSMIDSRRPHFESGRPMGNFHRYVLSRASNFAEFLENCSDEIADADGRKSIWRNQVDYVSDQDGASLIDRIGRFERLEADWRAVCVSVLGRDMPLPRINASRHRHYAAYYTPELAELVRRRYARDLAAFNYNFAGAASAQRSPREVTG